MPPLDRSDDPLAAAEAVRAAETDTRPSGVAEGDGERRHKDQPENTPQADFDRPIESPAPDQPVDPTRETYLGWADAYDFFNSELFGGELPPSLITYQYSRFFYGYFAAERFVAAETTSTAESAGIDEIAINPAGLRDRPVACALSTLVHEMAHLKRYRLVEPRPTPGYHDKIWARIMRDIGLPPSTTGAPGGKETGQRVSHYIIPGGRFDVAAQTLLQRGFVIRYVERAQSAAATAGAEGTEGAEGKRDQAALRRARSAASKRRFSCVTCQPAQNAWAKPAAKLICGNCHTLMLAAQPGSPA